MFRAQIAARSMYALALIPHRCVFSTRNYSDSDVEHCLDLLKSHDLERSYLQIPFIPRDIRL
jgi:hypothetical protein